MLGTVIPRFWRPRFWRPSQIGDFIYLVSSWAHLLHTYNLDFGDFDFGDLNFDRSQKSPKSRDDCTVKPLFKGAVNRPLNWGNPLNGGYLCTVTAPIMGAASIQKLFFGP